MVDQEKIRQKINYIESNLAKLSILSKSDRDEFIADFIRLDAAKYLLQSSIEAMIDIAHHLIARERYAAPSSAADAFKILFDNKVITEESSKKYALMAKFRNRIVHIYNEVNPDEVFSILQNHLNDFKDYIREIILFVNMRQ